MKKRWAEARRRLGAPKEQMVSHIVYAVRDACNAKCRSRIYSSQQCSRLRLSAIAGFICLLTQHGSCMWRSIAGLQQRAQQLQVCPGCNSFLCNRSINPTHASDYHVNMGLSTCYEIVTQIHASRECHSSTSPSIFMQAPNRLPHTHTHALTRANPHTLSQTHTYTYSNTQAQTQMRSLQI